MFMDFIDFHRFFFGFSLVFLNQVDLCASNTFIGGQPTFFSHNKSHHNVYRNTRIDYVCVPSDAISRVLSIKCMFGVARKLQTISGFFRADHIPVSMKIYVMGAFKKAAIPRWSF